MRNPGDIKRDTKISFVISLLLFCLLLLTLFLPIAQNEVATAALLLPCTFAVILLIKKRRAPSVQSRQVLLIMALASVLYLMLYYLSGLRFGFVRISARGFWNNLLMRIIPVILIIIAIEIIRTVFLAQGIRAVAFFGAACSVLVSLLLGPPLHRVAEFAGFMELIGMTLLPAVSWEVLYHYLSRRFGFLPSLASRLIVTLYSYIIPIEPAVPDAMKAFLRLVVPLIMWLFIRALYESRNRVVANKSRVAAYIGSTVVAVVMICIVMLISCQFRFGLIIIGSESMTGEIEKGDAVIFEALDDQSIVEGQVIVFKRNNVKVIHRVTRIETVNGVTRYYTKGDANDAEDAGFITRSDIIGTVGVKIAYIGYPTVWLRELFE